MDPSKPSPAKGQTSVEHNDTHAVRFSSQNQEIEPEQSLHTIATLTSDNSKSEDTLSPEAREEIRMLSKTLQESHLQHGRMSNFAFEPVSLPVSRVSATTAYYIVVLLKLSFSYARYHLFQATKLQRVATNQRLNPCHVMLELLELLLSQSSILRCLSDHIYGSPLCIATIPALQRVLRIYPIVRACRSGF